MHAAPLFAFRVSNSDPGYLFQELRAEERSGWLEIPLGHELIVVTQRVSSLKSYALELLLPFDLMPYERRADSSIVLKHPNVRLQPSPESLSH